MGARRAVSTAAALAAVFVLAACVTQGEKLDSQAVSSVPHVPENYRQVVIGEVKKSFYDPYSVRDASISKPIDASRVTGPIQTVCVKANAKNRMGGYVGLRETAFDFRENVVIAARQTGAKASCAAAVYEPFPEIEEGYKPSAPGNSSKQRRS
jgi:hypothetical protein